MACVFLSRLQECRRPVRLVRGVRIFLSLEAESRTLLVHYTVLSRTTSIEEVTAVELDSRFVSEYFQTYSCFRTICTGSDLRIIPRCIETPVVVESVTEHYLLEIKIPDIITNCYRSHEIHRSAFYRENFSCSHECMVNWCIRVRIDIQDMIIHPT